MLVRRPSGRACLVLRPCRAVSRPAAQGQEVQRLAALHLGAEQAAEGQWQWGFQGQLAAGQRRIEQAEDHLVDHLLGFALQLLFAGFHLALQQGADGQLLQVQAGQGLAGAGLQQDRQPGLREGSHRQRGALSQGAWATGFDCGLATVLQGQLEHHLEALGHLLQGDDFGLGGFATGQQPLHGLQQL